LYRGILTLWLFLLLGVIFFSGCKKENNPPNVPSTPSGPSNGTINTSYNFLSSCTDPDGDNIAIRFDWGDGSASNWSSYVSSGDIVTMSHSYSTAGIYYIKAQAKDEKGLLSDWSSGHEIVISASSSNNPPNIPTAPFGPASGFVDTNYNFTVSTTDPNEDSVSFQFDWGDGSMSSWSSYVPSGDIVTMSHSYSTSGTYFVKARAMDVRGAISGWSNGHQIDISEACSGDITPANFTASAGSGGTTVVLTWEAPVDNIDGYILYFENTLLDTLDPSENTFTHNPQGQVGTYKLYAFLGDSLSDPVTVSTEPKVTTAQLTLAELNAAGNSGLGFTPAWTATTYPMADPNAPDNVDFYFTDGSSGSTGTFQYLASADQVVNAAFEEGKPPSVPDAGWRENYITEKAPQGGIIQEPTLEYDSADSNSTYSFKVVRGTDYYYGTIELGSVSQTECTIVNVKVQTIANLRIIGQ